MQAFEAKTFFLLPITFTNYDQLLKHPSTSASPLNINRLYRQHQSSRPSTATVWTLVYVINFISLLSVFFPQTVPAVLCILTSVPSLSCCCSTLVCTALASSQHQPVPFTSLHELSLQTLQNDPHSGAVLGRQGPTIQSQFKTQSESI
jgi:hypothetical protein